MGMGLSRELAHVRNAAAVVRGVLTEDERDEALSDGVVGIDRFVADQDTKHQDGGCEVDAQVERGVAVTDDACNRSAQPAQAVR